jgi:hypothetical protein
MSKKYGSFRRLFQIGFARNTHDVLLQPDTTTTYTADRVIQLPKGDADQQLTSLTSADTLTNKTMSGSSNTFTNINVSSLTGTLPVGSGGTNSAAALSDNRVMQSSGGAIVEAAAITASRALASDANGIPTHSATTATELGYVSGVTSSIQTQLNAKQNSLGFTPENAANKGAANGYAPLNASSKIDNSYLNTSVMNYHGSWNASTNTPALSDGMVGADPGDVYIVSVAGTQNLGSGNITFSVGDWVIYSQTNVWQRVVNTSDVTSVNGAQGAVTVNAINQLTGDVTAGPASGSQSQAATIASGAITNAKVSATAAIDATKIGNGDVDNTELSTLNGVTSAVQTQLNGKANTALSNLTTPGLGAGTILIGSSASAVSALATGTNGYVLTMVGGTPVWSVPGSQSFKSTWVTADGTTKAITHNLGTLDVVVEIYDLSDGQTIDVDTVTRTSTNVLTVTATEAPNVSGWRVLITAI